MVSLPYVTHTLKLFFQKRLDVLNNTDSCKLKNQIQNYINVRVRSQIHKNIVRSSCICMMGFFVCFFLIHFYILMTNVLVSGQKKTLCKSISSIRWNDK